MFSPDFFFFDLNRYLLDENYLILLALPSSKMSSRLESEEKARVAAQVARLGPSGLSERKIALEAAKSANDTRIPTSTLSSIPPPELESIHWVRVLSASTIPNSSDLAPLDPESTKLGEYLSQDEVSLPFALHFDHVEVSLPYRPIKPR